MSPFRSKAQQRLMFAKQSRGELKPGTALEWAHATPDIKGLPERVKPKKSKSRKPTRPTKPRSSDRRTR